MGRSYLNSPTRNSASGFGPGIGKTLAPSRKNDSINIDIVRLEYLAELRSLDSRANESNEACRPDVRLSLLQKWIHEILGRLDWNGKIELIDWLAFNPCRLTVLTKSPG